MGLPSGLDAVPQAAARREGVRQVRHHGLRRAHPRRGGLRPAAGPLVHAAWLGGGDQEAELSRLLYVAALAAQRRPAGGCAARARGMRRLLAGCVCAKLCALLCMGLCERRACGTWRGPSGSGLLAILFCVPKSTTDLDTAA